MDFTTAFGSQEEPLEAIEDAPFTQMGDFMSQAPPTAPSLDRPKRPLHDASPDGLEENNKRPRVESASALAREVQAELERQRRTDQLMKFLGANQGDRLLVEETEAKANGDPTVGKSRFSHQEQQDRAEAERLGINFDFLEEQLARIGDVSNLPQPEDEILFVADDFPHKAPPQECSRVHMAQAASQRDEPAEAESAACSQDTDSDQEQHIDSVQSLSVVRPIIKSLPSSQSGSSQSALTSSGSSASSGASSDANVAAGSQEVMKDPAQSESSDTPASWPSSPARSVQFALERRPSEELPPDSSGPWPRDGSAGPQRDSSSRLSASSAPHGIGDHHMLSRNTVSGRNEMMFDENAEADDTDSDIDEVEPHALGEEVADEQARGTLRQSAIAQSVAEDPAPQVKETPYARRAQSMAMSGDGAFLSTHERTPSNPTRTPQTLIPSTIPQIHDHLRDDKGFQDDSVRSCVADAIATSSDKPTSGASQSAASDVVEAVPERRASMSQHANGKTEGDSYIVSRPNSNEPDRVYPPAMRRDGVGASLNLSSQRLVLEDPVVTARRTRREFMARVAHGRKVPSSGVPSPQLMSSTTGVPQPDATTGPQATCPPSPKVISSAESSHQSGASSTHAMLSQPPGPTPLHVEPPSEAASASVIRPFHSTAPSPAPSPAVVSPRSGSPCLSNAVSSQQASRSQGTLASVDTRVSTGIMSRVTFLSPDTPSKQGSQASRILDDSTIEVERGETGNLYGRNFGTRASDTTGRNRQDPIPLDDDFAHDESTNEGSDFGSEDHSVSRVASEQQSKPMQGALNLWYAGDTPFKEFARNYRRLKIMEGVMKDPEGRDKAMSSLNVLEWSL